MLENTGKQNVDMSCMSNMLAEMLCTHLPTNLFDCLICLHGSSMEVCWKMHLSLPTPCTYLGYVPWVLGGTLGKVNLLNWEVSFLMARQYSNGKHSGVIGAVML